MTKYKTENLTFNVCPNPIPCRLLGWTYGNLNAWATPGKCSTDVWTVTSTCKTVSIQVAASVARSKCDCDGLPEFYYD